MLANLQNDDNNCWLNSALQAFFGSTLWKRAKHECADQESQQNLLHLLLMIEQILQKKRLNITPFMPAIMAGLLHFCLYLLTLTHFITHSY